MNKNHWLVVCLVIAVAFFLYEKSSPKEPPRIKIGAALGLTGECANYGEGELKAARLAVEEKNKNGGIGGREIELVVEDTGCDSKGSVNAMKKLIEADKVEAIIGLTWGDSFQAGYTISNSANIVSVAPSAALEALYFNEAPTTYVFSTWFPEKTEIETLAEKAREMGTKKFALVHDNDTFGATMADLFKKEVLRKNLELAEEYTLPVASDDFRTIIVKIKNSNPDGIAIFFQGPTTRAKFLKEARELGLKTQVFTDASVEDPSLLLGFAGAMEGLIYTYPEVTGNKDEFYKKFRERYGTDSVGASNANSYDAARVVIAGLEDHYKTGVNMKTALERVGIAGTAVKNLKFDASHQITEAEFKIKTVRNGQFMYLK